MVNHGDASDPSDLDALKDAFSATLLRSQPPIYAVHPASGPHASLAAILALGNLEKVSVDRQRLCLPCSECCACTALGELALCALK